MRLEVREAEAKETLLPPTVLGTAPEAMGRAVLAQAVPARAVPERAAATTTLVPRPTPARWMPATPP
jgi:hypothetical protein